MNSLHYRNQLIALATMVAWQAIAPVNAQMPANGGAAGAFGSLQPGLGTLSMLDQGRTRSVTAENPTGEKGKGGMAVPNPADPNLPHSAAATELGQGWKVRPFLRVKAGETVTLMDVAGPGVIQHIWLVADGDGRGQSALGWAPKYRKLTDDVSSVAYWYQTEPHAPLPKLPSPDDRLKPGKPETTGIKMAQPK
jgi:hypothetical protein